MLPRRDGAAEPVTEAFHAETAQGDRKRWLGLERLADGLPCGIPR
ncbi:hypothetical protein A33M_1335 [Rhodovulum sp. PH10]|nr:hypothetical protein A33M_1335 [Rhodovulum sp. PH10]